MKSQVDPLANRRLAAAARVPLLAVVAVLVAYSVWFAAQYPSSHSARDFIHIGTRFLRQSHASSDIHVDAAYERTLASVGYDGQFYYYLALDPLQARYFLDTPGYRYPRILYSLLAKVAAANQARLLPYSLLLINWLAAGAGTLFLALWLGRHKLNPWFAMIFGFNPGLFVAFTRDLTEPLAYALVAVAVYMFDYGGRHRYWLAAAAFALAALAREVTAAFALTYGLALLWENSRLVMRRKWREALKFLALSLVPLVLYKLFLIVWLGSGGLESELSPVRAPLSGLLGYWPWDADHWVQALCVVAPALLWSACAAWVVATGQWTVEIAAFAVNVLLLVVFLNPLSYAEYLASSRISIGVILAAVLCLPRFGRLGRPALPLLCLAAVLWWSPAFDLYVVPILRGGTHWLRYRLLKG